MKLSISKFIFAFFCILNLKGFAEEPTYTFHLKSAYSKDISFLGELSYLFSELVSQLSEGKIKIVVHEPSGEIKNILSLEQDVSDDNVDIAFSGLGYSEQRNPSTELFTSVPFGPFGLEYAGWMFHGGGVELLNEYFKDKNMIVIPAILLPPEASGWFNKKIEKKEDLKNLKIRSYGLTRQIFQKLGAKPVIIPGQNIKEAFIKKTIDAAEFSSPAIDESLEIYKVAKYYYFPGWHQPGTFLFIYFNKDKWQKLPSNYQSIIQFVCRYLVYNEYIKIQDSEKNAIERLKTKTNIQTWSAEMMKTFYLAWQEVVEENNKTDPAFKKILESISKYRTNYSYWNELNKQLQENYQPR
jgi:TRAP-type mannitol/chloroaromatic compound transport system substrate-binding protein